jgi:hypothetical protein
VIEVVSAVALAVVAFCLGYRLRGRKDRAAIAAANEALGRQPVAYIIAWPLNDAGIDIPQKRGQA